MTRFALALACVLGTLGSAHADPVLRPVGEGCSRNSDCPDDKVCYPGTRGGGQCLPECSLDKDCATGFACSSAGACVASWGGLFGRIEIEPGLSAAACKAVLDGKSVDCDANGSFVFERAGAGKRRARIATAATVLGLGSAAHAFPKPPPPASTPRQTTVLAATPRTGDAHRLCEQSQRGADGSVHHRFRRPQLDRGHQHPWRRADPRLVPKP